MSTTDHTPTPTAGQVAEALAWFREDPDITLEQLAWGEATAAVYAVVLVRAALAAAPADVTGRRCPSCGNPFDGDNLCMPSACQWEGTEEEPARSVSPDDAHTETVTEYRAFGRPPADAWDLTGQGYVGESQVAAETSALVLRRCGYADVRVESRTVTTSRRESGWKATDQ